MIESADVTRHYSLSITFTEPLLGHMKASKHSSHSYFYKDEEGNSLLLDRHIMGFLKEAAQALNDVYGDSLESVLTRKVFIKPKEFPIVMPSGDEVYILDRPPRLVKVEGRKVETMSATSEAAPVGSSVECELQVYPGVEMATLSALLEYGKMKGIGLGRNQGYGKFEYELREKEKGDE